VAENVLGAANLRSSNILGVCSILDFVYVHAGCFAEDPEKEPSKMPRQAGAPPNGRSPQKKPLLVTWSTSTPFCCLEQLDHHRAPVSVHRSDRKRIVASAWLIFTALDSHKVFIRARTTRLKSLLPLLRSSCSRSALEAFVIYSLQQIPMHHPTAALPTNPMDPSAPLVGWWADSAHVCAAALPPPCDHSTKRRISVKSHVAWLHLYTLESQQKLDQRRETEDCREEQWSYAAIAHLIYVHALRSQEQPRHPC